MDVGIHEEEFAGTQAQRLASGAVESILGQGFDCGGNGKREHVFAERRLPHRLAKSIL